MQILNWPRGLDFDKAFDLRYPSGQLVNGALGHLAVSVSNDEGTLRPVEAAAFRVWSSPTAGPYSLYAVRIPQAAFTGNVIDIIIGCDLPNVAPVGWRVQLSETVE